MRHIWRFIFTAALLMAFSLHGLALDAYGQSDCITANSPNTMTVIFPQESLAEGDTIRARSSSRDLCAGEGVAQENGAAGITVRGDDGFDEVIGFDPGEAFDLYFVDSGEETRLSVTADLDGSGPRVGTTTFQNGTLYVVDTWQPAAQGTETITLSADTVRVAPGATYSVTLTHDLHSLSMSASGVDGTDTLSFASEARQDTTLADTLYTTAVAIGGDMTLSGTVTGPRTMNLEALEAVADQDGELVEVSASFDPGTLTLLLLLLGDIDDSGQITLADVQLALGHVLLCSLTGDCLDAAEIERGDMTGDGQVRLLDAALIYQAIE